MKVVWGFFADFESEVESKTRENLQMAFCSLGHSLLFRI